MDIHHELKFYKIMKQNTRFKGDGVSCIDWLITNLKCSFMKSPLKAVWAIIIIIWYVTVLHTILYSILNTKFEKSEPKKLIYRNFKQFDSDQFRLDICNSMYDVRSHATFENNFVSISDKHAPKKTKVLWWKKIPF